MVQRLVEAIRNDDSPPSVAKTLQKNIQALHERGELTKQDITETDIISLMLKCLSRRQPRSRRSSTASAGPGDLLGQSPRSPLGSFSVSPDTNEDSSFDEMFPLQIQSSNIDHGQYSTELAHSSTDVESLFSSNTLDSSNVSVYSNSVDSGTSLPTINSPQVGDFGKQTALHDELSQNRRFSEPYTLQLSGVNDSRSSMRGSDYSSSLSPTQGLTLPLIYPGDPMSDIALSFRDGARDLLKSGVSLQSVMGSGPTDVELLFRTRRPDDEYNVPGWACELSWGFQDVDWHVKLAEVFMRVRIMRWLILPNEKTFAGIPGILKPTSAQMRFPHSVAIDFLPIPTLRDILVRKPQDWNIPLSECKYSCNWDDTMGPAVITNPVTGRRQLSEQFEKHICDYQNWTVGNSILKTWPDLSGEIQLFKAV
ncbi:hypothetical protein LTR47_006667 [Exophiala xenobiotica]|nr:hypothetical protein LTR47_006667 [Exophiala xenobiotica]KAK5244528.1 hypothetical protein LTS06_009902 [Exophiala xenobiotica]KAK5347418.1 hypothetical protein LTR61_009005 [Exophiala xenobiotica]KAK5363652.1 hypothetical protein LTR11_009080 [Exophiala xenobiotica]KAK5365017.1 hypothetical protein LTS03_009077 [Exophiala xenobiotica]